MHSSTSLTQVSPCMCFPFLRTIYVSFGGLLMSIKGEVKSLKNLEIDSRIYLLMSKI